MKRYCGFAYIIIVCACSARAGTPVDRLLAHVPDDTALMIVVPSAEKLAQGIAALGRNLELEDLAEIDPADLFGELDLPANGEGLDLRGPIVVAMAPMRPAPVVLCITEGAEVWKRAVGAESIESGLYKVRALEDSVYAAFDGDVVIIGRAEEDVRAALRAEGTSVRRLGAYPGQWLITHHVVLGLRVQDWSPLLVPVLNAFQASLQMGMAASGQDAEHGVEFVGWLCDQMRGMVAQVETLTVGVRVGGDGVFAQTATIFDPAGSVTDYLGKVRKTTRPLLRGLSDSDDLLVLACEWDLPPGTDSLWCPLLKSLLRSGERADDEDFQKALKAMLDTQRELSGYNMAMSLGPPEQALVLRGLNFTKRPEAVLESMRYSYELDPELMGAFGVGHDVKMSTRREQIGAVNGYAFEMCFDAEDEEARRMIQAMYGEKMTTCAAPHAEGVMFASGSGETARARLDRMLAGKDGRLVENQRVKTAQRALSPDPQCWVLVDLMKCFELGVRLARTVGAPVPPIKLPSEATAFVTAGVYLDGNTVRSELFVPAEPVKALIRAVESVEGKHEEY